MAEPFIIAENLSYTYRDGEGGGTAALRGVSFRIDRGEYVAVLGHNGSGKSTLAKLMNGILIPTGGKLTVCGTEMREGMSDDEIFGVRRRVGMVFQNPDNQLVATIVEEDVAFGPENLGVPREEIRRRVDDALRTVGMYEYKDSQPHRLSGGQKRRAAIAGVMAMCPEILVLDEPAAGLDPMGREEIFTGLARYRAESGATVVVVSHSMEDMARYCDRLVVMNDGKIILRGTQSEVFGRADELRGIGLGVPDITRLCALLRAGGMPLPDDIYTVEAATAALLPLLGGDVHAR